MWAEQRGYKAPAEYENLGDWTETMGCEKQERIGSSSELGAHSGAGTGVGAGSSMSQCSSDDSSDCLTGSLIDLAIARLQPQKRRPTLAPGVNNTVADSGSGDGGGSNL